MDCTVCSGLTTSISWNGRPLFLLLHCSFHQDKGHIAIQATYWTNATNELRKQKILREKQSHNIWCSFSALITSVDFDEVFTHLSTFTEIATFNRARIQRWFASFFFHLHVNEEAVDRITVNNHYSLHIAMLLLSRRKLYENFRESFSLNHVTPGNLDTNSQTNQRK